MFRRVIMDFGKAFTCLEGYVEGRVENMCDAFDLTE